MGRGIPWLVYGIKGGSGKGVSALPPSLPPLISLMIAASVVVQRASRHCFWQYSPSPQLGFRFCTSFNREIQKYGGPYRVLQVVEGPYTDTTAVEITHAYIIK